MKSLVKAVEVIDALARAPGGEAGVSDLSRETGLDKAIVHRILRTLLASDVVAQSAVSRRYRLGTRPVEWAGQRLAANRPLDIARQRLLQLWNDCGETVHFTAPVGDQVVVLQVLESIHQIRVSARLGERVPMHCTASGKVLLALGDAATRDRVLARPLAALTPKTLTTPGALLAAAADIRRHGFATDLEECLPHANAVAAPILDRTGVCVAAVAVIGPAVRFTGEVLDRAALQLMAAARDITAASAHLESVQWHF